MDLVNDKAIIMVSEDEDRISNLPDTVIHHILSLLDTKYAIQTCTLSRKWKHTWTSMPYLNLNSLAYDSLPQFAKFVRHVLSHRNDDTPVYEVTLVFSGLITQLLVNNIVNYAYLHNVEKLVMNWSTWKYLELPQFLLNSHTLKHLSLTDQSYCTVISTVNSAWDFPVLESLSLSNMRFGDGREKSLDLFSKCVNLKDLTLHRAQMLDLDVFNVCAPQLLNLTITDPVTFPKVFNVVTPHLKNLTASIKESGVEVPRLLRLWTEGLDSLEKVNLSLSNPRNGKYIYVPVLLDLFQKVRSAKFLTFSEEIIEILSSYLDQLSSEPCPFDNLKCLKIDKVSLHRRDRIAQVRKYFLDNSPNATFIMDLPKVLTRGKRPMQAVNNNTTANKVPKLDVPTAKPSSDPKPSSSNVSQKRPGQQVIIDLTAKKKTKLKVEKKQTDSITEEKRILEAKVQMQEQVNAKQKAMFEAKIQKQDEVTAKQKTVFEKKVRVQDEVIAKQKEMFEAKIQIQDKIIAEQKTVFEATIQMQDEVIAKQKAMFDAKIQMQDESIADQKAMFAAKIQMQDEVIAKQKDMFAAKLQMQDEVITEQKTKVEIQDKVIAEQKAKIQMQDENIAKQKMIVEAKMKMLMEAKLQHEKLMSLVIKCKIAELRLQLESGNPDYEVIRLMGNDIKSVMGFIPESLRVAMETQFSFQYVELKSLFFTCFDANKWAKIETELGYMWDSVTSHLKAVHHEPHVRAAKLLPAPNPSSSNASNRQIATSLIVVKSESQTSQASKNSRE